MTTHEVGRSRRGYGPHRGGIAVPRAASASGLVH